ncbi:NUDIX domain-containing protein [Hyphomicrobium denitrificans]|uniref:NUDIX domain-containing protein n=1 Tax=Hyphomicrobium denitrificans TaxID=53399 RepID=UPI00022E6727|nr:NUDIX domain-containing protein [Hyphomicrobium denitrificans]
MPLQLASHLSRRSDLVTLGVQGVIANAASEVLLVRHGYRPGWHFPGGGVERRETIDRALCRELNEEAGVILVQPARLFGIYTNFEVFPGDHVVLFIVEHWRQDHIPAANAEISEQRFFALDRLPRTITAATKRRLDEVFGGAERANTW